MEFFGRGRSEIALKQVIVLKTRVRVKIDIFYVLVYFILQVVKILNEK